MKIATTRFGELDLDDSKIIVMPDGIVGFPEKRFTLLTPENHAPFCWFQSVDNPALAFVVLDARQAFPDYKVSLTPEEYEKLQLDERSEVVILLVVTLASDPSNITVNLQGPVVLNPDRMIAKQIILEGGKFPTRHPLFTSRPDPAPTAGCAG